MLASGTHPDPLLHDLAHRAIDALLEVAETTNDLAEKRRAATAVLRFLAYPRTSRAPADRRGPAATPAAPGVRAATPLQADDRPIVAEDDRRSEPWASAPDPHNAAPPPHPDPVAAPRTASPEPPAPPPGRAESRLDRAERRRRVALERLQSLAGSPPPHDTS